MRESYETVFFYLRNCLGYTVCFFVCCSCQALFMFMFVVFVVVVVVVCYLYKKDIQYCVCSCLYIGVYICISSFFVSIVVYICIAIVQTSVTNLILVWFAVRLVTCVVVVVVGNITSYNIAVNRYRSCCSCCCCWVRFSVQRGFYIYLYIFLSVCL